MKFKYIDLINNFWRFYDENKDKITPSDIILYKIILRYFNKLGLEVNPFTVNPFIMAEINPLSKNTYYNSLKKLNDLKIIKWEKGKNNISNQKITILKINTSVGTSINNSIDTSIKFSNGNSVETSINNSVGNNNKTIRLLDNNTIKLLEKKDFDFLINSNEFKQYLKDNNIELKKCDTDISLDEIPIEPPEENKLKPEFKKIFDFILEMEGMKHETNYANQHITIYKFLANQEKLKTNPNELINQFKGYYTTQEKKYRYSIDKLVSLNNAKIFIKNWSIDTIKPKKQKPKYHYIKYAEHESVLTEISQHEIDSLIKNNIRFILIKENNVELQTPKYFGKWK